MLCEALLFSTLFLAACNGNADLSSVGDRASDILRNDPYTTLYIEFDHLDTVAPPQGALNYLRAELERLLAKPGGVVINAEGDPIPSPGEDTVWTHSMLREIEAEHRDFTTVDDTVAVYFLAVDGHWDGNTDDAVRMATAYGGSSVVIYNRTIDEVVAAAMAAEPDPDIAQHLWKGTYSATVMHEFGHIAGLVDVGTPMINDHVDPDSPGHDSNPGCIMASTNNSAAVSTFIRDFLAQDTESLQLFGDECMTDVRAMQGGE